MVQHTRHINRAAVLTELFRAHPTTRGQIVDATGISAATVSRTIEQLLDEGLVFEVPGAPAEGRGRPSILIDVVAQRSYVLGIDLGASTTRFVVVSLVAQPVARSQVRTPQLLDGGALALWLNDQARIAAGDFWPDTRQIALGLPGAVSGTDRSVSNAPNLPQVEDKEFLATFESAVGRQVLLDNDANFALLGEQKFGAARDSPTAAMLTIGAGLGVGLALEGHIIRGPRGMVGEFGHLPVGPLGTRLEQMLTGPRLLLRAQDLGIELESPADLFNDSDNSQIRALRAQFDQALLIALTAVIVSCEPSIVVLGGGIAKSLGPHLPRYEEAIVQNLQFHTRLTITSLGDFAGALGAAVAALQKVYQELGVMPDGLPSLPPAQEITADLR
ncbi:ROK family protein [Arthrobacter sp. NA-172]|uniref:ROK family transcriptional regulator n=1 Tax=Arthrobacter sp. NA-172 TaxID=3367524 RepID=UPI0037540540